MADFPGVQKRVTITITDETAEPPKLADPDELVVTYGKRGTDTPIVLTWTALSSDAELVRDDTGAFHVDVLSDEAGTWAVSAKATEGVVGVNETSWVVERSHFPAT